jgi:MoaA/NifB/PqqE/SkfB family radical SAM enzyme
VWPIFNEKHFDEKFGFSEMGLEDLQKIANDLAHIPDGNLRKYYEVFPYLYRNFSWIGGKYECFAGRAFVYVDSLGNLFPCSLLTNQPMGSLLDERVEAILLKPELKNKLDDYKRFKCGGCTMSCYMEKNIILSSFHNPFSLWKRAT